jgi:CheY-like chemotaxis protein
MRVIDNSADARTTVLVANGDPMLRLLVRASLDRSDYSILEASSGSEALVRAREEHPDLILLDMMMPLCSGPQVLAELRRDPATATTPVIMLTARPRSAEMLVGDHERSLAKPFSPRRLAALVADLLAAPTLTV